MQVERKPGRCSVSYPRSLYTNIPNHKGIEAIKEVPNKQSKKPMATKGAVKFLYSYSY